MSDSQLIAEVQPGAVFEFRSRSGELLLIVLVLEVRPRAAGRRATRVLVLDRTRPAESFRAKPGETTDWLFDERSWEWDQLRRVS